MIKKVTVILLAIAIFLVVYVSRQKPGFIAESPESVIERMVDGEKGIYVYGFEDCPWCQDLYPVLNTLLKDRNQHAYVVDIHKKDFSKGNRKDLKKKISENTSFDEIIVPFIIMISEDGFFQYHVGTVEGYDASTVEMTSQQSEQLYEDLLQMINAYESHNN